MAKSQGFLSDLATILLGARATLTMQSATQTRICSVEDFLASPDWNDEILRAVNIPFLKENQAFNSYKTAVRPVNSHAWINAAFLVTREGNVITDATLAFGGVQESDVRGSHALLAKKTAAFLLNKELTTPVLQEALEILRKEVPLLIAVEMMKG